VSAWKREQPCRVRRATAHENFLVATFSPRVGADSAARHVQCMCEQSDETFVGRAVARRSLQADAQPPAANLGKTRVRGSRLDAQARQGIGAADHMPVRLSLHKR